MKLQDKITLDIKKSMIGKHTERTTLLRTIIGEINRDKDKDISDDKVIAIIKKMKENAELMNDLNEVKILSEYLPEVLTEAETIKIIENMFNENSYTQRDMGNFMKEIKTKYGQTIDMKIVSATFKNLLNE